MRLIRASRTFAAVHIVSTLIVFVAVVWSYVLPPSGNTGGMASNGLMLIGVVGGAAAFLTSATVLLQWMLEARAT